MDLQQQGREERGDQVSGSIEMSPDSLLAFYKNCLDNFEKEREEYLDRIALIEASHGELHRTKWDLRVQHEEISNLKSSLSDANCLVLKEREQNLTLLQQNDNLKIQQIKDRQKLQHLLALTQPQQQQVTFYRDCRPNKITSSTSALPTAATDGEETMALSQSSRNVGRSSSNNRPTVSQQQRILRTIYLPDSETEGFRNEIESLKRQLNDVPKLQAEQIKQLEHDRIDRENYYQKELSSMRQHVDTLEKQKQEVQNTLILTTKDYLQAKRKIKQLERENAENIQQLHDQNAQLHQQVKVLKEIASVEAELVKNSLDKDNRVYMEQVRKRVNEKDRERSQLRSKYQVEAKKNQEMRKNYEQKIESMKTKYKALEKRRTMDLEGFSNDITQIREQMRKIQQVALGRNLSLSVQSKSNLKPRESGRKQHLKREVAELRTKLRDLENEMMSSNRTS